MWSRPAATQRERHPESSSVRCDARGSYNRVQVTLTDDELLDFDSSNMPKYEPANSERALSVYGDAFRYQLVAAKHIHDWADRLERPSLAIIEPEQNEGFVKALREVAAYLRQGEYLPRGTLYVDTVRGSLGGSGRNG